MYLQVNIGKNYQLVWRCFKYSTGDDGGSLSVAAAAAIGCSVGLAAIMAAIIFVILSVMRRRRREKEVNKNKPLVRILITHEL